MNFQLSVESNQMLHQFALLNPVIGPEISGRSLNQSEVKVNTIATWPCFFSRA